LFCTIANNICGTEMTEYMGYGEDRWCWFSYPTDFFDISYLNHMPNMTILSPRDGQELSAMLEYALSLGHPCAIRYPRGTATSLPFPHIPLDQGAHQGFPDTL